MLKNIRHKIAGWLLGDETALFLSKEATACLDKRNYLSLNDKDLVAVTRRWFVAIESVMKGRADEANIPVVVYQNEHAVLGLAQFLREANATSATIKVKGTVDNWKTTEDYILEIQCLPHDPSRWGDEGVNEVKAEDGRLIELAFSYRHGNQD